MTKPKIGDGVEVLFGEEHPAGRIIGIDPSGVRVSWDDGRITWVGNHAFEERKFGLTRGKAEALWSEVW